MTNSLMQEQHDEVMTQLLIKNEMIMLQWYMEAHNYNEIEIED
jgi:hypothetical protein